MNLGFIINSLELEKAKEFTTTSLALSAHKKGHTVYYLEIGDLTYYPDGQMGSKAYVLRPDDRFKDEEALMKKLKSEKVEIEQIKAGFLDVLSLRYNPEDERDERAWIKQGGLVFGQIAVTRGVLVLSHPYTLSYAINKMYFQHFPEEVRPKTIISRSKEAILKFYEENNKHIILKPLEGSGGQSVYNIDHSTNNLNQIIQAMAKEGYIIGQEYLPDASKGDVRFFLMNGKPLVKDGKYAAVHRLHPKDDFRSNISVGATIKKAKVTKEMLKLAEIVGPKIRNDGLFLVGLDIVGDKLIEINVISSGALQFCSDMEGVNFCDSVIESIERKLEIKSFYKGSLSNKQLAVMDSIF